MMIVVFSILPIPVSAAGMASAEICFQEGYPFFTLFGARLEITGFHCTEVVHEE